MNTDHATPQSPPPPVAESRAARSRPWFRRYPVAAFLVSLILAFVSSPFEESFRNGDLIEWLRLVTVVLFGLLALSDRRRTLVWGIVLVTPSLAGKWVNHWWPALVPVWLFLAPGLVFCVFVVVHLLRFIIRAPRIDSEVLCAGVAGYLMLALLWAGAYAFTAGLVPGSFVYSVGPPKGDAMKQFTALYYSVITLTTVGYGDIVPVSGPARMLAMMEAITGTLYLAVMIARLVSLYSLPSPASATKGPERT